MNATREICAQRQPGAIAVRLAIRFLLAALPAAGVYAATGLAPVNGNATPLAPGSVPVSLTVSVNLSGLHPAATKGALECGAVAQTKTWIDAHRDSLVDYDTLYRWVLGPAHYYGGKAILDFPMANGSYVGALTYTTALSAGALIDSSTRAPFAPGPSIIVACWLQINGRPAAWDQGTGLQVVSSSNFASVNQKPLIIAVAETGAGTPVNVTGQLSAQGLYFSPAPVALVEDLAIAGPNARATTANTPVPPSAARASAGVLGGVQPTNLTVVTIDAAWANRLASELAAIGVPVSPDDVARLTQALHEGGAAATALAEYLVEALTTAEHQQPQPGLTNHRVQLSSAQVDSLIQMLTTSDNSGLGISQLIVPKLAQLRRR
jgi:hypothetical protein